MTTAEAFPLTSGTAHLGRPSDDAPVGGCSTGAPVRYVLPATTAAPGVARQYLRRGACPVHLTDPGDALLLVTELVTNALLHGAPPIGVAMRCTGTRTIVSVTDFGDPPVLRRTDDTADALSGRGLRLLDALASGWGVDLHAHGKTFWFTL